MTNTNTQREIIGAMYEVFLQINDRLNEDDKKEAYRMLNGFNAEIFSAFTHWFFVDMMDEPFRDEREAALEGYCRD